MIQKIIERLETEIQQSLDLDEGEDATSWSAQVGILITRVDAECILEELRKSVNK